jgi:hypothetical protein
MSFFDTADKSLDRIDAALNVLLKAAVKAKAYNEVAQIAAVADTVAGFRRNGRDSGITAKPVAEEPAPPAAEPVVSVAPSPIRPAPTEPEEPEEPSWVRPTKDTEPSWMRPKSR